MGIPTKILTLITAILLGIAIGWHIRGNEDAGATLKVQQQEVKQGNKVNDQDAQAALQHEQSRAGQQRIDAATSQAVAIAAQEPNYHTCQLKPEDLQLLNDAIAGGAHVDPN